jgi:hypothetical protein
MRKMPLAAHISSAGGMVPVYSPSATADAQAASAQAKAVTALLSPVLSMLMPSPMLHGCGGAMMTHA